MYGKLQEMMYMTPEEADFNKFTLNDCRRLNDLIHQGYLAVQRFPSTWSYRHTGGATFTCGTCKPKRSTAPKRPKRYEKMPKFVPYVDSPWGPKQ